MAGSAQYRDTRGHHWRIAAWSAAAALLSVPLVAMQFTDEATWTLFDFVAMAIMLGGVGLVLEFLARKSGSWWYRAAAGTAMLGTFLLVWINLAVGIIGSEDNIANLTFAGVPVIGVLGATAARFEPAGMRRTLIGMAAVQALIGTVALIGRLGAASASWPWEVAGLTGFFTALWLLSAWLFGRAALR